MLLHIPYPFLAPCLKSPLNIDPSAQLYSPYPSGKPFINYPLYLSPLAYSYLPSPCFNPFLNLPTYTSPTLFHSITIYFCVLPRSVRKSTPPIAMVLLNFLFSLGSAQAKPKERSSPVFFILSKLSDINIPVLIYLNSKP